MVRLQSVRLCYGLRGIRPIRFEDSIRKRIGRPIRLEIWFERKNDSQVPSLVCLLERPSSCSVHPAIYNYFGRVIDLSSSAKHTFHSSWAKQTRVRFSECLAFSSTAKYCRRQSVILILHSMFWASWSLSSRQKKHEKKTDVIMID